MFIAEAVTEVNRHRLSLLLLVIQIFLSLVAFLTGQEILKNYKSVKNLDNILAHS